MFRSPSCGGVREEGRGRCEGGKGKKSCSFLFSSCRGVREGGMGRCEGGKDETSCSFLFSYVVMVL